MRRHEVADGQTTCLSFNGLLTAGSDATSVRIRAKAKPAFQWPVNGRERCDNAGFVNVDTLSGFQWNVNGRVRCDGSALVVGFGLVVLFQWPVNGRERCDGDTGLEHLNRLPFQWPVNGRERCDPSAVNVSR